MRPVSLDAAGQTDKLSNEPRGRGTLGFVSGRGCAGPEACLVMASDCARTNRTGLLGAAPLSGAVVDALEKACREGPEIMRMIVPCIHF
jgi:hypothetical protein